MDIQTLLADGEIGASHHDVVNVTWQFGSNA